MSDLIQELWRIKKFTPNDEQGKAILFDEDRPMFITAAPGSGKTRVLLWRTVHLIVERKISPDEIFLSTFTEKAAHQLKEGLKELLGIAANLTNQKYDLARMYVGTIQKLSSGRLLFMVEQDHPKATVSYIINRVTSLDWGLLDLFYQLTIFGYFRNIIELAARGGPVYRGL